ncbi:23S rRNA pseudouridine(2604) synthase RluF [Thalassotalea euphylliae]|uniref:Pseudouridine synthase n=1 Tax=Thalassotalea euphylliae TaxID=1655234 RepID=A0A3E0TX56_9GAMM|nr:23S rRNA pseudouridine(2604) synthase RluF [Thalassotalea euphylliae]
MNKFISESGFCSRREADKLIEQQRVTINGKLPELGTKVQDGDQVAVDGKPIAASAENKSDRIYIAYHKPIGVICTTERQVRGNIVDAIGHQARIFPIGRLDKPSEGLIFLTSDGDIVNKILRAENAHDKEYIVTVDKPISERFVERMSRGVPILGTITNPCRVEPVSRFVFKITLTQGLNRQIRRMCEYLGYEVTKLKRVRIMNVDLTGLKPGQWRNLTKDELAQINSAVKDSRKTSLKAEQAESEGKGIKRSRSDKSRPNANKVKTDKATQKPSAQRTNLDTRDAGASNKPQHKPKNEDRSGKKPAAYTNRKDAKHTAKRDHQSARPIRDSEQPRKNRAEKPKPISTKSNTYRIDNPKLKASKKTDNEVNETGNNAGNKKRLSLGRKK